VDTGWQRGIGFTLSQELVHGADTKLFLEVKIKLAIVPSLREQIQRMCRDND